MEMTRGESLALACVPIALSPCIRRTGRVSGVSPGRVVGHCSDLASAGGGGVFLDLFRGKCCERHGAWWLIIFALKSLKYDQHALLQL